MSRKTKQLPAKKNVGGRPRAEQINADDIERLAVLQCTQSEVAAFFRVSLSIIEKRLAEFPAMREAWERGLATGRISLRRAQYQAAVAGNVTAQIWLGKQYLGQSEKLEMTGANGSPLIPLSVVDKLLAEE